MDTEARGKCPPDRNQTELGAASEQNRTPSQPEVIGDYRVLEEAGRGGMGVVYKAVHRDDECGQPVAVKVLKPGFDSEKVIRHFERERQILANLRHPYIVAWREGGQTRELQPYLVMEYIDGLPLTRFCARHRFSIPQRISLFLKVCEAVQVAHRNLIVHLDLKPGNILITPGGDPKLLDFGLAKLLQPGQESDTASQTHPAFHMLTPGYASPEWVAGERVSVASDVYSLGVVLFELLTGSIPFAGEFDNIQEWLRIVSRKAPPKPSAAWKQDRPSQSPHEVEDPVVQGANHRRHHGRLLQGDLDSIVLKALCREPGDRYASVLDLKQDLERHQKGYPVQARRRRFLYATGKFLTRHWRLASVAAAAIFLLAAGLVRIAHHKAQTLRAQGRSQQLTEFAMDLFALQDPFSPHRDQAEIDRFLDKAQKDIDRVFAGEPLDAAYIYHFLGVTFLQRGRMDQARRLLVNSLNLREKYLPEGLDPEEDPQIAEMRIQVGHWYRRSGDHATAISYYRKALPVLKSQRTANPEAFGDLLMNLTASHLAMERREVARAFLTQAESLFLQQDPLPLEKVERLEALRTQIERDPE
ncbi:Non-specific serine/threonine protein kinase [Sulfidibacter corallicola]|uniref:Serine/threonine protein kinase n=1 Tax=Sulfidibacter corallicola TaxID=2818388 RepID=A0A8A4TII6_SULCO|nr:serine/threonine-protein kinase [Sulfidibacter corallicola]QTD48962.1 serine/threonine protein kinase [Sulfidibacter corallicola]